MTIEIRELIIEARVSEPVPPPHPRGADKMDEETLIRKIVQQVLSQLRDEMRGMK